MNNSEQIIKLSIHRLMNALSLLAEGCKVEADKWNRCEVYFKLNDGGVAVDSIALKDVDKVCRRKYPRIQVEGKEITFNNKKISKPKLHVK